MKVRSVSVAHLRQIIVGVYHQYESCSIPCEGRNTAGNNTSINSSDAMEFDDSAHLLREGFTELILLHFGLELIFDELKRPDDPPSRGGHESNSEELTSFSR